MRVADHVGARLAGSQSTDALDVLQLRVLYVAPPRRLEVVVVAVDLTSAVLQMEVAESEPLVEAAIVAPPGAVSRIDFARVRHRVLLEESTCALRHLRAYHRVPRAPPDDVASGAPRRRDSEGKGGGGLFLARGPQ